ncbi:MOB kinase activator-like 1A protein [Tanacetum coccineum]|uniref:MOB kinase activator-like 1A protein n=1 Tax=Tanacetum coccineum TaxID=301880 RepID=A0ABQ4WB89_9ASTR
MKTRNMHEVVGPHGLAHHRIKSWKLNHKTFRPKKSAPSGSKGAQLKKHIDATLGSGNLREAVRLPPGEDLNEWLAINAVDFFNQVNLLYGTLTEFCTSSTCPTMTAGAKCAISSKFPGCGEDSIQAAEFRLIDKEELAPLYELVESILML